MELGPERLEDLSPQEKMKAFARAFNFEPSEKLLAKREDILLVQQAGGDLKAVLDKHSDVAEGLVEENEGDAYTLADIGRTIYSAGLKYDRGLIQSCIGDLDDATYKARQKYEWWEDKGLRSVEELKDFKRKIVDIYDFTNLLEADLNRSEG